MKAVQLPRFVLVLAIFGATPPLLCIAQQESPNALTRASQNFVCPEDFGDFEDPEQCDKFWRCEAGVPTAHLCEDGLVFDYFKADGREDPCDSPFVVNCEGRPLMQEPTFPSEYCPRIHGIFPDPDRAVCDRFYTCKGGQHTMTPCSPALHFNENKGNCDWPDSAGRTGCAAKKPESIDGFTCPTEDVLNKQGIKIPHPSYPNLEDCQLFYTCLSGVTPRKSACDLGKVFDERSMLCDYPENVPECEGWYKNDPRFVHYYYDTNEKATDPGAQDTVG